MFQALAWLPWQPSSLVSGGGVGDGHIRLWNTCTGAKTSEAATNSQVREQNKLDWLNNLGAQVSAFFSFRIFKNISI